MRRPKVISIHQPCYLPWLGYFEKIDISDVHVVLDTVQFEKNSFINRNKIKTPQGWCWLTVPVLTKGRFEDLSLRDLHIDNRQNWQAKHFKSIISNYGKAPFFNDYIEGLRLFYEREWKLLATLNIEMLKYFINELGINTKIVLASSFNPEGEKSRLVLNICKHFKASEYLSGELGRQYLNEEEFKEEGIEVSYQSYKPPAYRQLFGESEPYMSIVDLLMNCGDESRAILLGENKESK